MKLKEFACETTIFGRTVEVEAVRHWDAAGNKQDSIKFSVQGLTMAEAQMALLTLQKCGAVKETEANIFGLGDAPKVEAVAATPPAADPPKRGPGRPKKEAETATSGTPPAAQTSAPATVEQPAVSVPAPTPDVVAEHKAAQTQPAVSVDLTPVASPAAPPLPAAVTADVPDFVKTAGRVSDIVDYIVDKEGLRDEEAVVARMEFFVEKVTRLSRVTDIIGRTRKIFVSKTAQG